MPNAAMLWTGGKDSAMALHEACRDGLNVRCLVTFAPPEKRFLAHPLPFMQKQAEALALPHHVASVAPPFEESYPLALKHLRDGMGIDCVVTGDIAEVDGYPNWIRQQARPLGLEVCTPLWNRRREVLLQQLFERGFRAIISCVDTRRLAADWVGRALDASAMQALRAAAQRTRLDSCGENGEYHSLVTDAPDFGHPLQFPRFKVAQSGHLAHMDVEPPRAK